MLSISPRWMSASQYILLKGMQMCDRTREVRHSVVQTLIVNNNAFIMLATRTHNALWGTALPVIKPCRCVSHTPATSFKPLTVEINSIYHPATVHHSVRKTLDPDVHVDVTWQKPSTTWHNHPLQLEQGAFHLHTRWILDLQQDDAHFHTPQTLLRNRLKGGGKELKASTWPQNAPDPNVSWATWNVLWVLRVKEQPHEYQYPETSTQRTTNNGIIGWSSHYFRCIYLYLTLRHTMITYDTADYNSISRYDIL